MDYELKKILRSVSLELRHTLEGTYDERGDFHPGDLEDRLNALGVWRDRPAKPLTELGYLPDEDKEARRVVDAYLAFRAEAGVGQGEAVAEFVRESAYTWANRLLCLRCMEARSIIDEVILQKEVYGQRSMVHNRLGRQDPALLATPDEGLFAVLSREFELRARELPGLFNPKAPAIALRPSLAALKKCIGLLSGTEKAGSNGAATDAVFAAPDALGWAYQYWNAEEKDRVFEKVRTERGAKIEGADMIPATQLYTEPYMVKFLVQNSLGALWMGLHPDSNLVDNWEYYVRDADRAPVGQRHVQAITFLDPACGSGHFHMEAFDLLYAMYEEEGELSEPESICAAILNHNLYGVDIDERAVQIAQAALWMKAKEIAWELEPEALTGFHHHFVATNIRLPRGKDHLEAFLRKHPEDLPLRPALETVFEGLENAHELGSLLQLEEPVEKELRFLRGKQEEAEQEGFQSALFAEMDRPRQGKLPVGVESYAAWKDKVLSQLRADFEAEGEAADLAQAFFGRSAGKGLALFDILARRYSVVAMNPPYMGSRTMNAFIKAYLVQHYTSGKRDLYAAFVLRSMQLTEANGLVSTITMNKWLYARAYAPLRCGRELGANGEEKGVRNQENILWNSSLLDLVDLGSRAFDPENKFHDGVQVAMFTFVTALPTIESRICILDCTQPDGPEEKSLALRNAIKKRTYSHTRQSRLSQLPGAPLLYRLSDRILLEIQQAAPFGELAKVRQGICTTNDQRFVRMFWEAPNSSRWIVFAKGGGHKRWDGLRHFVVDWAEDGVRIKQYITDTPHAIHWSGRMPESAYFFKEGWSYSRIAYGSLGLRCFRSTDLFGHTNPIVLFESGHGREHELAYIGLLNSPTTTYLLRNLTQSNDFHEGYLLRMAFPLPSMEILGVARRSSLVALEHSQLISRQQIDEATFAPTELTETSLYHIAYRTQLEQLAQEIAIATAELVLQRLAYLQWNLADEDIEQLEAVMGGSLPPVAHSELPRRVKELLRIASPYLKTSNFSSLVDEGLIEQAASFLNHSNYSDSGRSEALEINESEDSAEDTIAGDSPMPSIGMVDEFARVRNIDCATSYIALAKAIESYGASPEWAQRAASDLFTVLVLQLLGYRWPTQVDAQESVPNWADKDGIIPLSSGGHGESTLFDRIKMRVASMLSNGNSATIEREFADIIGEPLLDWLTTSFFLRHTSQFKKRPIAWQLETTTSGRGRGNPAFSCLVYYHRLDADLLPKIRSQYIRDLRQGYETEQRTLRQLSRRTSEQDARLLQLDAWLDELGVFAEKLEQVSVSGFGDTPTLQAQLQQYAIDDAMQSLKAVWLRRLAVVVAGGPLQDWQRWAAKTEIHSELGNWIAAAVGTLDHHCASVGAKSPQAGKLKSDPDARALAAVIGTQSAQMVKQAISLACNVWFDDLDSHVLRHALDEINELKAQVSEQEEKLNDLGAHETRTRYDVEQAVKSLKARIKKLTKARNEQRKKAKELREHIEGWTCPEAAGWTEWLGAQPLFDQFASSDGQKSPPRTIADFVAQESRYDPDINDGVRVNIAPLQKAGLLAADVLAAKDVDKAIADRADWRADERRWCREGKLFQPGWWDNQNQVKD